MKSVQNQRFHEIFSTFQVREPNPKGGSVPQCPSKLTLVHTFGQITGILIWSSIHRMYMCRKMFVMMTLLRLLLIETKVGAPLILEVSTLIFTHDSTQPSGGNANVFEKKISNEAFMEKNSEN